MRIEGFGFSGHRDTLLDQAEHGLEALTADWLNESALRAIFELERRLTSRPTVTRVSSAQFRGILSLAVTGQRVTALVSCSGFRLDRLPRTGLGVLLYDDPIAKEARVFVYRRVLRFLFNEAIFPREYATALERIVEYHGYEGPGVSDAFEQVIGSQFVVRLLGLADLRGRDEHELTVRSLLACFTSGLGRGSDVKIESRRLIVSDKRLVGEFPDVELPAFEAGKLLYLKAGNQGLDFIFMLQGTEEDGRPVLLWFFVQVKKNVYCGRDGAEALQRCARVSESAATKLRKPEVKQRFYTILVTPDPTQDVMGHPAWEIVRDAFTDVSFEFYYTEQFSEFVTLCTHRIGKR